MKFFHVYNDHHIKGLVKNGLVNKDTGFKLQSTRNVPPELKFNQFAAKGTKFYEMIKEGKIPFYVDRIAGGGTYHYYDFDRELIQEYKNVLGEWFLGFQLHESGSNRRLAEWPRMIKAMGGSKGPYDLEELKKNMKSHVFNKFGLVLYRFSQDTPEYYCNKVYAETYQEFIEEMKELFTRRLADTDNNILPCDSYYLATKLQNDLGMETFMPEVGCQIPLMRVAVALARGMANVNDKKWGAYYECWREIKGVGYCMPCFNNENMNEWYVTQDQHGTDDFSTCGPNGGSSRLLQDRIYHHALMSGADLFSEEWGLNCSYTDMQEFTLSHYGIVKKEFINRALEMGTIKAKIPFAIVLPNKYSCIELPDIFTDWNLGEHKNTYLASPLNSEEIEYFGHIEDVLKLFFARTKEIYGNEGHVLTNSLFGDLFDIVYEDTADEKLAGYEYLIDASKEGSFKKAKANTSLKIIESADIDALANTVNALTKEIMPCFVNGLPWIVSYDEKGNDYLTIFNNEGNERDIKEGDIIHHEADKVVEISFKENTNLSVFHSLGDVKVEKIDDKNYKVFVPATGFVIFKF